MFRALFSVPVICLDSRISRCSLPRSFSVLVIVMNVTISDANTHLLLCHFFFRIWEVKTWNERRSASSARLCEWVAWSCGTTTPRSWPPAWGDLSEWQVNRAKPGDSSIQTPRRSRLSIWQRAAENTSKVRTPSGSFLSALSSLVILLIILYFLPCRFLSDLRFVLL